MKLDQKTLRNSQKLRKEMTKEERHLWYDFLKSYPVQFKRQFPIGNYNSRFLLLPGKTGDRDGWFPAL